MGAEQARAVVEARLGRPAQDALEAAIVLEAWGGLRGSSRFGLGAAVIDVTSRQLPPLRSTDVMVSSDEPSAGHSVGLMLALSGIAVWMAALSAGLGFVAVRQDYQVALPVTLALEWLIFRRYLGGREGPGRLRRDYGEVLVLLLLAGGTSVILAQDHSVLPAALVFIWTAGFVLAELGWGAAYAMLLLMAALASLLGLPVVVGVVLVSCLLGVGLFISLVPVPCSMRPAAPWRRAGPAGLIGGGLGLLIAQASGSPQTGPPMLAMLALFPTLIGTMWGFRHLSRLWIVVPGALITRSVRHSARFDMLRVATGVILAAIARATVATAGLSLVVLALGTHQSAPGLGPVLLILGGVALVGMVAALLEGFGHSLGALAIVISACVATVLTHDHEVLPGMGGQVIVPVVVAFVVALWPLGSLLSDIDFSVTRSGI